MIEVIRPGRHKINRYRYTCVNCFCEFEYSWGDIGKITQENCEKRYIKLYIFE